MTGAAVERLADILRAHHRAVTYRSGAFYFDGQAPLMVRLLLLALREPTGEMTLAGLLALVTEIEQINGPRVQLTKGQMEGTEDVDDETTARRYMQIGSIMRNGLEVGATWRAMIDALLGEGSEG